MASEYYGINRLPDQFQKPAKWTVGTSSGSTDIELRVDTGKGTTRMDIIRALDGLRVFFLSAGGGAPGQTPVPPPL